MGIHDDCKAGADIKCKPEEFVPDVEEAGDGRPSSDRGAGKGGGGDDASLYGQDADRPTRRGEGRWKIYMQGMPTDHKAAEYWPLDARAR